MDNLAERHLRLKTITYDEVTGKGAARIPFDAGERRARDRVRRRRRRRARCGCIARCIRRIERDEKLCCIYRDIEMPVMPCSRAWSATACCSTGEARRAELTRARQGKMLELETAGARGGRAAVQPRFAASRSRRSCSTGRSCRSSRRRRRAQPSTDEDVLAQLALDHPLPKLILEYRALSKLKSTYTDKLPRMINPKTGRVHT